MAAADKLPKTKTDRIQFTKLDETARRELVSEIVAWGLTIWHSNAEDLTGYWLEKKSYETVLYTLRTQDDRLVGSATMKFYKVNYEGKDLVIVKLGLGVNPEFRGSKFALRCLMSELLRFKTAHPTASLYLFSTLIHPVTYKLCCDLLHEKLYPYFGAPENPAAQKMVAHLAGLFGVEKADSPIPFLYKEKFSAIETEEATTYWRTNQRPEVRFYVENCPNYYTGNGDCVIMVAPIELTHVLALMIRTLARNRMDKWRGRKHRFAAGGTTAA